MIPLNSITIDSSKKKSIVEQKFWASFSRALATNKRGSDGKRRILSIIAQEFGPKELREKLLVNKKLIIVIVEHNTYFTIIFIGFK